MPYKILKNRGKKTYRVINSKTGKVHSKHTTKAKAKRQIRLLYSKEK